MNLLYARIRGTKPNTIPRKDNYDGDKGSGKQITFYTQILKGRGKQKREKERKKNAIKNESGHIYSNIKLTDFSLTFTSFFFFFIKKLGEKFYPTLCENATPFQRIL